MKVYFQNEVTFVTIRTEMVTFNSNFNSTLFYYYFFMIKKRNIINNLWLKINFKFIGNFCMLKLNISIDLWMGKQPRSTQVTQLLESFASFPTCYATPNRPYILHSGYAAQWRHRRQANSKAYLVFKLAPSTTQFILVFLSFALTSYTMSLQFVNCWRGYWKRSILEETLLRYIFFWSITKT